MLLLAWCSEIVWTFSFLGLLSTHELFTNFTFISMSLPNLSQYKVSFLWVSNFKWFFVRVFNIHTRLENCLSFLLYVPNTKYINNEMNAWKLVRRRSTYPQVASENWKNWTFIDERRFLVVILLSIRKNMNCSWVLIYFYLTSSTSYLLLLIFILLRFARIIFLADFKQKIKI